MLREDIIEQIQATYLTDRTSLVDEDYLVFEEETATLEDLQLILSAYERKISLPNPHNSCLLYVTGLSLAFDFAKERCNTIGGSPPDIDIDFEAEGRETAIELVVKEWGRDNVANIVTHGTLRAKSLTNRFAKLSTPEDPFQQAKHSAIMGEISSKIPKALFGKEATLKEIVEGDEKKGYSAHPELATETKYKEWYKFANQLEEMVCNFGIHASGIVISEFPIYQQIPTWANGKADHITQYDMKEVESLGLIKFDFLGINNLDVIKECIVLIEKRTGKKYDMYKIPDGDTKAYELLQAGLVQGIFQMETSKTAKELILEIKPKSIEELSDISALNRPGPLEHAHEYIGQKNAGKPPEGLPPLIADIIKDTYWILLYQEQVMRICTDVAGYTLREADDIRRAMGKKKLEILIPYKESFVKGCTRSNISESYATEYWDKTLLPFADYSFNKSHSVAYSITTYLCAYFKANYPMEFFCALMTIRSRVMPPKDWAEKAPEYIQEAKTLGVNITSPSVQNSQIGFTINEANIFFGLNAIRGIGVGAARAIMAARGTTRFKDIWDFLARIDQRVVNAKTFESLVKAGAFDTMGYQRQELLDNMSELITYLPSLRDNAVHNETRRLRDLENLAIDALREELDEKTKAAKKYAKECKKLDQPILPEIEVFLNLKEYFDAISQALATENCEIDNLAFPHFIKDLYSKYGNLKKLPKLKEKPELTLPVLNRSHEITINVEQLMEQAEYIGCYLGTHPARVVFPQSTPIALLEEGERQECAGQIVSIKVIKTKKTQEEMAFIQFNDGTASAEVVLFPRVFARLASKNSIPSQGDLVSITGDVKEVEPTIKLVGNSLTLHRRQNDI